MARMGIPWKRNPTKILTPRNLLLMVSTGLLVVLTSLYFSFYIQSPEQHPTNNNILHRYRDDSSIKPFDCYTSPQAHPIFANTVEGLKYPFIYSLSDFGTLPDKPHKNIVRTLKGKPFRRPDISVTVQGLLEKMRGGEGRNGIFVDVGANVGMATFAAAVMGFKVLAFEPVFENLQRICEGIYFNRITDSVQVFRAAASDRSGNITFHKLVGRLDNSAISASGARMAFKSNEEIAVQVKTIPLDDVIRESEPVLMLKIDVQGWEYHVLKGATKLLSRKKREAPYLIYEEDERLLKASNSSAKEIRKFLHSMGYHHCTMLGTDAHCIKTD
ncbi:hypothetical protein BUALT_Bualt09G0017700 [Buddleja alternifolia]|uniref:Methyltransferase FkbM domain-containing protein n=1 Tax=Buddleja alternifolia TaxID=168488 RepID=A0AAV6X5T4_9LAMI|nr:hypothetical protein BUALT_Bualt09G0017700 [Buddleja alternifolia]